MVNTAMGMARAKAQRTGRSWGVMFEPLPVEAVIDAIVTGLEAGSFIIAPGPKPMEMFKAIRKVGTGKVGVDKLRLIW